MAAFLRDRITLLWLVLIVGALLSWAAIYVGPPMDDARLLVTAVLAVVYIQIRVIGLDFMELRNAPLFPRLVFEGWLVIVWGSITIFYGMGAP